MHGPMNIENIVLCCLWELACCGEWRVKVTSGRYLRHICFILRKLLCIAYRSLQTNSAVILTIIMHVKSDTGTNYSTFLPPRVVSDASVAVAFISDD